MQWQMACTQTAYCDFASFDPRLPIEMQLHVRRVHRDDERDSWWEHPSVNLTWGPSSDHAGKIIGCMSALDAERWLAAQGMEDRL